MTPLMKQYNEIKNRFQNSILLFHLGDFYEMFNEDAILVSSLLGLHLTKRGETPMCGIPLSNLDFYLKKVLFSTHKSVAICNQIETVEESKIRGGGLVARDVVRVITRGNFSDPMSQDNNFILSITSGDDFMNNSCFYLCYADFSSGECYTEEVDKSLIHSEIYKINPSEIIIEAKIPMLNIFDEIITIFPMKKNVDSKSNLINEERAIELLNQYAIYLKTPIDLKVERRNNKLFMRFSQNTIKNLEILINSSGKEEMSLFSVLNKTKTPEGRRLLKANIVRPLTDFHKIEKRQQSIEDLIEFFKNNNYIKFPPGDLAKLLHNINSPKQLRKIGELIFSYKEIYENLKNKICFLKYLQVKDTNIDQLILNNIVEDPGEIGDGNCFSSSEEVKNLISKRNEIINEIFALSAKYSKDCSMSFKIKNNSLIGYFFEFTKNRVEVPSDWILVQGLSNSSRYINPELIELSFKLKENEERLGDIEKILFAKMKDQILRERDEILTLNCAIGWLDFFSSCAINAIENNYFRPKFVKENLLEIQEGRHPVIEKNQEIFIDNDLNLNENKTEILITGPNMGGKSTYLRQNALLIIMAQIGMFVPGKMTTKIFDSVLVRIGSSDNISNNESTFMLEMKECSEIIALSTENSFIVLDEVGRGTSTNDGMSICFAILEYIHDYLRSFALISTHYNELSSCETYLTRFVNYKLHLSLLNDKLIFLYKVIPGIAESSFGIFVAEKANLPKQIILRSKEIFAKL